MAQPNFEEKLEIEKLHIESTDVMTGDRNKSRFLLYQLKLSMAQAKQIDIIVFPYGIRCKNAAERFKGSFGSWRPDSYPYRKLFGNNTTIGSVPYQKGTGR